MKIWQRLLIAWGILTIVGLFVIINYVTYSLTLGNGEEINKATKSDVRFVLNWCELGDDRIEKVLRSYKSPTSFTGDHFEAYSIKISHLKINELKKGTLSQWYRCDSLPKILDDAVTFVGGLQPEAPWFPDQKKLRTKDFYVYSWSIGYHGTSTYTAQLIFINPKDKIIYYMDGKI